MKKLLLIVLIIISTSALFAQKFGVKGGLDLSTYSSDNSFGDYKMHPGLNVSMFYQHNFLPFLSIRPELGYYQKGTQYTYTILTTFTENYTINYLQFGLDLRIKIPLLPIYFLVGPYGSYALSGTKEVLIFQLQI